MPGLFFGIGMLTSQAYVCFAVEEVNFSIGNGISFSIGEEGHSFSIEEGTTLLN
jgi:hypothetical protein